MFEPFSDSEELTHSRKLFVDSVTKEALKFTMPPCNEAKRRIRIYIMHGGGLMVHSGISGAVRLGNPEKLFPGEVDPKFIMDCVAQNKLLDMDPYRVAKPTSRSTVEKVTSKRTSAIGRAAFTPEEDRLLLDFIKQNGVGEKLGGNRFWQNLTGLERFKHRTYHSWRDHYLKHLKSKKSPKARLNITRGINRQKARANIEKFSSDEEGDFRTLPQHVSASSHVTTQSISPAGPSPATPRKQKFVDFDQNITSKGSCKTSASDSSTMTFQREGQLRPVENTGDDDETQLPDGYVPNEHAASLSPDVHRKLDEHCSGTDDDALDELDHRLYQAASASHRSAECPLPGRADTREIHAQQATRSESSDIESITFQSPVYMESNFDFPIQAGDEGGNKGEALMICQCHNALQRIAFYSYKSYRDVALLLRSLNGRFEDVVALLAHGQTKSGLRQWTGEEDAQLKTQSGQQALMRGAQRRTRDEICNRLDFLGIPH